MTAELGTQAQPFRLEEATIEELHAAIKSGQITCVEIVQHYIDRVRAYNGVASALVTPKTAPGPCSTGRRARASATALPTATVKASTILPDLDKYKGRPRIRSHGGNGLRSCRAAAVWDDRRHTACRAGECARHPQHPGRAFRHLQGDFDRHVSEGPLPRRTPCARSSAGFPTRWNVRLSSMRRMDGIPTSSKCRCMASSFRSRIRSTPRHALHRRGDALRHRFPARDHGLVAQLEQGRSSSPRLSTRNTTAGPATGRPPPDQVLPSTLGYQRSTWGGNPANPTTRHGRPRSARVRDRGCRSAPIW